MATDSIKIIKIEACENPQFIKPRLVTYMQDGIEKSWEIANTHDSVSILLYHDKRDAFILVKQFRPAIYLHNQDGYTHELCAGLVDKEKDIIQIAKEEILEECGYDVPLFSIEKITAFHTAVGFAGGKQTLYYAQVDDSMKVSEGGGIDDEAIEVVYLPLSEVKTFMFDERIAKTPGLLFSFMWFLDEKR
jgi:UDP-sugar diphosphatase